MQTCPSFDTARTLITLIVGLWAATVATATESERWAILKAIHCLENPRNLARPGPRGELGAYQFREITWRCYTKEPFFRALDRNMSDFVATRHYEWLKSRLEEAHIPATPYNIALAWNGGIAATLRGQASRSAHDYAQRAENLVGVFEKTATVADVR